MTKFYILGGIFSFLSFFTTSYAQQFSQVASTPTNDGYNYIDYSNDTMFFTFASLPATAFTDGTLTISGDGYYEPGAYYEVFAPGLVSLGTFGVIYDCANRTTIYTIPVANLIAYGSSAVFKLAKNGNIYPYCNNNRISMTLTYQWCATGVPIETADANITDKSYCENETAVILNGLPAGGVFSGLGVTSNSFDPSMAGTGIHKIAYTYTEANGCYTSDTVSVSVNQTPAPISTQVCEALPSTIVTNNVNTIYSLNSNLNPVLDEGVSVTLPAFATSPTTVYTMATSPQFDFSIQSLDTSGFQIVDHDNITGDDRGGMAVTENYVYIVGDDNTGRYDLDLTNLVALPVMDGMFTDLAQLKLYTLYNTNAPNLPDGNNNSGFVVNSLRGMDENLNLTNEIIYLSETVSIGFTGHALILAGYNEVIVGSVYGGASDYYRISILNGSVTNLGQHNLDVYGSENWADWGMSGFDGTDHHAYFRENSDSIMDYNFTTQTLTSLTDITDFSDMASFIVHPVNNKMYLHYEGGTSTFGGNDETLMSFGTNFTSGMEPSTSLDYTCLSTNTISFNSVELGQDTTVCSEDGVYILEGGFGFDSYTWNGVNNNFNIYPVQVSEQIILSVTDNINCVIVDTINVTVEQCTLGVSDNALENVSVYPVPNNGDFKVDFGPITTTSELVVIDVQGKVVYESTIENGTTSAKINLSVQPGIYFVRISSTDGSVQRPIVIQ